MPREFSRSRRIEEQLLRTLAELVRREVKDPRVGLVTLTAVEVSKDLSHAKVYYLPFDPARDVAQVGRALGSAAGFLRSLLRKSLTIRHVPELHFVADESIDRAAKLSALINRAVADDVARHVEVPGPDGLSVPGESRPADEPPAGGEPPTDDVPGARRG